MSGVDIHPEELIDKLERGTISPAERMRLDSHLVACEVCRFELVLRRDLEADVRAADMRLPERVWPRPEGKLSEEAITRVSRRAFGRSRIRRWSVASGVAAALFVLAAVSLASYAARRGWTWRHSTPATYVAVAGTARAVEKRAAKPAQEGRVERPTAAPIESALSVGSAESLAAEPAAAEPVASGRAHAATAPHAGAREATSAALLFSAANEARRAGDEATALELYHELERRFPAAQEAMVSHVIVGRLLMGTDPASALREFDAYLGTGAPTMVAEAWVGRARSLASLELYEESRAAWRLVLARFPRSAYADEAKRALGLADSP